MLNHRRIVHIIPGEPYLSLIGALIDPTMRGFTAWLQGPCGRFWCETGGLDPKVVYNNYLRVQGVNPIPGYQEKERCYVCRRATVEE